MDADTAKAILDQQFVEVIIAPDVEESARSVLASKPNVRVLACGFWPIESLPAFDYKRVTGGLLVQDRDIDMISEEELKVVTKLALTAEQLKDLMFTWKVAKFVKSNAIVYG